jgi:excisionase family DNA binding protein
VDEDAPQDRLLTYQQAAEYCGVSYETFRKWAQGRYFPVVDLGHRTKRVRLSDIEVWLKAHTSTTMRARGR